MSTVPDQGHSKVMSHTYAMHAENKRLKGRTQLLQEEVAELRSQCDSKNLEASQAQGSAALHKSKLDEQAAQILLLKRQLIDMEDEVCITCCCVESTFFMLCFLFRFRLFSSISHPYMMLSSSPL